MRTIFRYRALLLWLLRSRDNLRCDFLGVRSYRSSYSDDDDDDDDGCLGKYRPREFYISVLMRYGISMDAMMLLLLLLLSLSSSTLMFFVSSRIIAVLSICWNNCPDDDDDDDGMLPMQCISKPCFRYCVMMEHGAIEPRMIRAMIERVCFLIFARPTADVAVLLL